MESEESEGVVGVAGHLGEGPSQDHGGVDGAGMGGGEAGDDGPDEDQTGRDLYEGGGEGGPDETEKDMEDLESGERLDGDEDRPGVQIGGWYVTVQQRGEISRKRVGSSVKSCGIFSETGQSRNEDDGPTDRRDDVECEEIHEKKNKKNKRLLCNNITWLTNILRGQCYKQETTTGCRWIVFSY